MRMVMVSAEVILTSELALNLSDSKAHVLHHHTVPAPASRSLLSGWFSSALGKQFPVFS